MKYDLLPRRPVCGGGCGGGCGGRGQNKVAGSKGHPRIEIKYALKLI